MARPMPVRGLTEGAVLAAVAAVLALAAKYVPLLGAVAVFLCPLPLTVLTIRHGLRVALLASVVATGIGTMVGGLLIGASIGLAFAPAGVAMGIGIRHHFPAVRIWLLTAVVAMASVVASAGLALVGIGLDPRQELAQAIQLSGQSQQTVIQFYDRLGIDTASLRAQAGLMQQAMEMMPRLLPFLLVSIGASVAYLNLLVGRSVLRRLRIDVPAFPPMSTWRVPASLLWILPAGMLCLFLSGGAGAFVPIPPSTLRVLPADDIAALAGGSPTLAAAGMNLVTLGSGVFSVLGLIAGWVLMERYNIPRWYRWIVIWMVAFSPGLSVIALFLGVADSAYDLRSRWRAAARAASAIRDPAVK